jgi:hypothetical protein
MKEIWQEVEVRISAGGDSCSLFIYKTVISDAIVY